MLSLSDRALYFCSVTGHKETGDFCSPSMMPEQALMLKAVNNEMKNTFQNLTWTRVWLGFVQTELARLDLQAVKSYAIKMLQE